MPFSLSSYLLGVGTVVGALALGFGGGVLLTKTAMKDGPLAETRIERAAHAEPASTPPQAVEAKAIATPPAEPPAAGSGPPIQAGTEPEKPIAETPKQAEPAKAAGSTPQTEPMKSAEQSTKPAEPSTKPVEPKQADLRKAEEKIERQKRYAERKARNWAARTRPRQFEEQPEFSRQSEPSRPVFAVEREEPRLGLFDTPLFSRSRDMSPDDSED